jgi:hypothetical protein
MESGVPCRDRVWKKELTFLPPGKPNVDVHVDPNGSAANSGAKTKGSV